MKTSLLNLIHIVGFIIFNANELSARFIMYGESVIASDIGELEVQVMC